MILYSYNALLCCFGTYSDVTDVTDDNGIDFSTCKDVTIAFTLLTSRLHKNIKQSDFAIVKFQCLSRTHGPMQSAIEKTKDIDSLFYILGKNSTYFHWMNIDLLETIAAAVDGASHNTKLTKLVEDYYNAIYSRTLRQVWDAIPRYARVKSKYYSKLQTVFRDKDPENVTVKEVLTKCKPKLQKNFALDIMYIDGGSLKISWLIATNDVYKSFLSLIAVPQEEQIYDVLQVGAWVVHHPQRVLQEYRKLYGMFVYFSMQK